MLAISSYEFTQETQHPRIRSSKPKHPSKTWRIHADSTQASPLCFYHVIGTPNPLAFASAASLALRSPDALNTTPEWADWWSWKLKIFCQIVWQKIISYNSTPYCRFTDDHTFWFEDLETIPEDFTETLLAKHQILQTADIYKNRRNLWLIYLIFVSTKKWSWDTLAQVRQCLQFCSLWRWRKGGTVATMNGRDNPFGATKLERKNTLRRIKIQKL